MKKITFFKTLLVAAGLLGGSNAWAEDILTPTQTTELKTTGKTTTEENSGRSTTVYYNAEATSWVTSYVSISGGAFKNQLSNYDGSYFVITKFDASSILSDKTLVSATLKFNSVCTVSGKNSAVKVALIGTEWDAETATWNNTNTSSIMSSPVEIYSSSNVGTTKTLLSVDVKSDLDGDEDKVVGFAIYTGTAREQQITDLQLVIEAVEASSATTYTIERYEVGGGLISSQSGIDGIVGNIATAESSEATFYAADGSKKYVFDSENANNIVSKELVANAESNVLKLYFNAYSKYTATIQSVCGENSVADITTTFYSDETPTLYWPKVVNCSDGYYVIAANASEPYYGYTFSSSDLTKTITYTLDEAIVYYDEFENICTGTYSADYFIAKSSKGRSKALTGSNTMTTAINLASEGVYDIEMAGGNRDNGHTTTMEMKLKASNGDISDDNVISQYFTGSAWISKITASKVTIPAGSELYIANDNGTGNGKFAGDYIIVRKSSISATIYSAGFATLYTPYALDFSGVSGLTAYTATVSDNTVTLTAVDDVPANTGVVLKGDADTYSIPVIASSSTDKGSLTGSATTDLAYKDFDPGYTYYILTKDGDKAQFNPVSEGTITAGKAYLKIADGGSGAKLRVVFADDATAIKTIAVDAADNAAIYNLSGQRVNAAYKGIVIKNGKKYLNK